MATNAKKADEKSEAAAEDELKKAKEESEEAPESNDNESTEADETAQSDDESPEDDSKESSTFTKGVPSIAGETPEEYQANLEKAYQESTKEALRLKDLGKEKLEAPVIEATKTEDGVALTLEQLYIRGKQKEETDAAFAEVRKNYPQVNDPEEYKRFIATAQVFGRAITDNEGRFPSASELYRKTVIDLGWTEDDSKEKLGAALKDGATSTRTGVASSPGKSKVSEEQIAFNLKVYPDKTRAEIIKELEPHII